MIYDLVAAIGLVCILEGLLPFLAPKLWRKFVIMLAIHNDQIIRRTALITMLIGSVILILAHRFIG